MSILALDTATPATSVALARDGAEGEIVERRHDPAPGERPGHAVRLLGLVEEALQAADCDWSQVGLIAVGVGPGTFTGLRIGVASASGLARSRGIALTGVSSLRALAANGVGDDPRTVLAVLDARRGEAFAAAWHGERVELAPCALDPASLAIAVGAMQAPVLALGDGAVKFRAQLESAGAAIPPDASELHRISAGQHCRLAAGGEEVDRETVLPNYLRLPDAEIAHRLRESPP